METVNLDGEVVKVEDLRLDLGDRMVREPIDVPVYIGATGPRMMELAGETAAGVFHSFFTSTICLRQSLEMVERGAARAGRSIQDVDMPHMLAVAMSDDAETVWNIARHDVTMYAGQQPHIGKASGVARRNSKRPRCHGGMASKRRRNRRRHILGRGRYR